jgi:membrane-associated protein
MELIKTIIDFVLHIDVYLGGIIQNYGTLSYLILFAIIFAETGFVFTPFLPGDSLLFAAGAFAAAGAFNIFLLLIILWVAAFLGDTVNYWIGHFFGQKLLDHPKIPLNQKHIDKTNAFFEKHGGKAIFIARFVPIVRTFAPFVAGIGKMSYKKFSLYNAIGGFVWAIGITMLGFLFGNIPIIKENFSVVIFVIIGISLLPILYEFIKSKLEKHKQKKLPK